MGRKFVAAALSSPSLSPIYDFMTSTALPPHTAALAKTFLIQIRKILQFVRDTAIWGLCRSNSRQLRCLIVWSLSFFPNSWKLGVFSHSKGSGQGRGSLSLDSPLFPTGFPKVGLLIGFLIGLAIGFPTGFQIRFLIGFPTWVPDRGFAMVGFLIGFPTGSRIGLSIGFPVTRNCPSWVFDGVLDIGPGSGWGSQVPNSSFECGHQHVAW